MAPEPAEEALSRETTLEPSPTPGAAPFANGSVAASEAASPAERPFAPLAEAPAPQDDTASLMSDSGPPFEDRAAAAGLAGETPPHDEPRAEPDGQVSELVETYLETAHAEHLEASPPREAPLASGAEASPRQRCSRRARLRAAPAPPKLSQHISRRLTPNISKRSRRARLHSRRTEAGPRRCPRRARLWATPARRKSSRPRTAHAEHLKAPPPPEASLRRTERAARALTDAGEAGRRWRAETLRPRTSLCGYGDERRSARAGRAHRRDLRPPPARAGDGAQDRSIRPESGGAKPSERSVREIARALVGRPPEFAR